MIRAEKPRDSAIKSALLDVLIQGASERFEDGYNSVLSCHLTSLASRHGNLLSFIDAIGRLLDSEPLTSQVKAEALNAIARLAEGSAAPTRDMLIRLLTKHLKSPDPVLRDGALVAFDVLEDVRAAPLLRQYATAENISYLKKYAEGIVSAWGH